MSVESVHGALRTLFLAPWLGDFRARQVSVLTGALLILLVSYRFVAWLGTSHRLALLLVGLGWLALTLAFEIGIGRFVLGLSWERLASDFDVSRGGLLPFGLIALTLSPLIAARWRGLTDKF